VKKIYELKLKMDQDKQERLQEEQRRKEEEWKKKAENAARKRKHEAAEKREREQKRRRQEEVVKAHREMEERQRLELEKKTQKQKGLVHLGIHLFHVPTCSVSCASFSLKLLWLYEIMLSQWILLCRVYWPSGSTNCSYSGFLYLELCPTHAYECRRWCRLGLLKKVNLEFTMHFICTPFVLDQEEMEKERKTIEEELKRQKRLDKEREVEQCRKKKELAWLDQKEDTRNLKEEVTKQMKLLEAEGRQQAVKVLIVQPRSISGSWLSLQVGAVYELTEPT
jgi:hypothetical protein